MNKDYIKLELNKILELLANQASSNACREKIGDIVPFNHPNKVREELEKTGDAFRLSAKFGTPRFDNIRDPGKSLKRATQGGSLSLREILDIASVLREINRLTIWYKQCREDNSLTFLFAQLIPNKALLERIDTSVISEEELADSASPELFRIRRAIEKQSLLIREKLDKLTRNADTKKFLQEGIVTQRDGRFVVPVKIEYKNEVPGLVHDTSGSGATLFVEPMGVVESNNQIRILKSQEKDEIERIIAEISAECGGFAEELVHGFTACIKLELCFAKSNFSAKIKGTIPEIIDEPIVELIKARHPLIDADKVVPVSLTIGTPITTLVITGPNTGGKTVALKTAGLLTLMARCGLMLPAADGSRIGVFGKVFADIGDEQSIEQSLSTFSSHMNNIVRILSEVKRGDLVLLDELGSGTDPSEGGALAVAILDCLKERGALVIGTTHYQEVKIYALETDGVENASCEFDISTLRPTYRLITGAPGKSNALAIAKRLGLSDDVTERASNLVSSENKRFENVIGALENSRREVDELKEELARNERAARELTARIEAEGVKSAEMREKEMSQARRTALAIVESVRQSADAILDELEELKKSKDKSDFSQRVRGMRSQINSSLNKLHDEANPVEESVNSGGYKPPRPYKKYDTVKLVDIDKRGSLISMPDSRGDCLVQIGIVKTKTNVVNLRLVEEERVSLNGESLKKSSKGIVVQRSVGGSSTRSNGGGRGGSMECDIRGMTCDEGIVVLQSFIDSSIMNHIPSATIIHGKGTGVLRRAVHEELGRHRQVANYRLGKFGEGEDGVTIVQFR
jgi:DNA mismatch repair protein MutS2